MSFQQYSGTNNNNQNLNVGIIIADQFIQRTANSTVNKFDNIEVLEDATIENNLIVYNDISLNSRLFIGDSIFLNNNLYPGINNNNYISGNYNGIGINTIDPSSIFHITGNVSNILSVSTSTNDIYNIIGENVNNKGITVYANNEISEINFYNDSNINNNNTTIPDATIQYHERGNLNLSSNNTGGNINLISTNILSMFGSGVLDLNEYNTTLDIKGNIQLIAKKDIDLYSENQTLISYVDPLLNIVNNSIISLNKEGIFSTSNNGIFFSKKNNNNRNNNINNETITIFDSSNSIYLNNIYNNNQSYSGNAATFVASDNNSVTQTQIITPNNKGISIIGGVSPNDNNRSMGVLSIPNIYNDFNPSISIVSGNNKINNYSTIGINTYSPKTEQYVLDINGPTHIGSGEINILKTVDFEINFMKFSQNNNFGIAVGTTETTGTIGTTETTYNHTVLYSINNGIDWNNINIKGFLSQTNFNIKSLGIYNNIAIIGGDNNYLFFISNINNNILIQNITYDSNTINSINTDQTITTISIAISGTINVSIVNIVLVYYIDNNSDNTNALFYNNISIIDLSNNNGFLYTTIPTINPIQINFPLNTKINDCCFDNSNNIQFFGNGKIYKYKYDNGTITETTTNANYNNVYFNPTINKTTLVALGTINTNNNNIISLIDVSNLSIIDINTQYNTNILNNVYIYDQSNAIIVNNNGNIIYSTDWTNNNWNNIPFNILNSSGIGNSVINNNLKNIYMKDLNTFIITKINNGKSQILNCYLPNIFNNANNFVLDISGNMTISGNININDSGNLSSNNNTFYLLNNDNINNIYFGGKNTLTTLNNNLKINNKLYCNNLSSLSINDNISFFNDESFKGKIYIGNKYTKVYFTNEEGDYSDFQTTLSKIATTNENVGIIYQSLKANGIIIDDKLSNVLYTNNITNYYLALNYKINNYINTGFFKTYTNKICNNTIIDSYTKRKLPSSYDSKGILTDVFGGGIYIEDSSTLYDSSDGYILVSSDAKGYFFKAPASYNVVNLNIGNLTLPRINDNKFNIKNKINNGILVLSNNYSNLTDSANYSIEVNPIDISNILLRDANSTSTYQNILTNMGVSGDLTVSLNNRLFVYGDASINSKLFVYGNVLLKNNLFVNDTITINTTNTKYNLDVSGNINFNGILNPVTLIDNSVLLTNTPTLDYSNNFCNKLINTNTNINNNNNIIITISSNGMYQYVYSGIYIYNSYNYGISWIKNPLNSSNPSNPIIPFNQIQTIIKTTSDGSIIYIGNKNTTFLIFSNDYGNSWQKTVNFNNGAVYNLLNFNISSNGQLILLLCYYYDSNSNYNIYLFNSNDYGKNFINKYIDILFDFKYTIPIDNSIINMSSSGQYQIFYLTNTINSIIYISNNYGLNWNTINNISSNNISSISSISISSSGKYIAIGTILNNTISTSLTSPLYFSSDYGNTFNDYSSKITFANNWNIINMSANGQYIIGIDSGYNKILTSINYGNTWNYINTPYSIISSEMSANGQYITLIDSLGNIYYSVTPYINISISNNLIVNNDMLLNGRAFINSPVIQF